MNKYYKKYNSIIGSLTIISDGESITNIEFGTVGAYSISAQSPIITQCIKELDEYFKGTRKEFTVKINPKGTEFQKRVWNQLLKIPYGKTASYKEIAIRVDNEKGSRAVGNANNKNPIPIIIPCHRVIGTNNKLVGYAGGLDIKTKLLNLEGGLIC